jgi:hypothetical protein
MKIVLALSLPALMLCTAPHSLWAQPPVVPDWAQPGSATHVQLAPPPDSGRAGGVSLAAGITYPDPNGYSDRKAVLVIRQDLDDWPSGAAAALAASWPSASIPLCSPPCDKVH